MLQKNHLQKDLRFSVLLLVLDVSHVNAVRRDEEVNVRVGNVGLDREDPNDLVLEFTVSDRVEEDQVVLHSFGELGHAS